MPVDVMTLVWWVIDAVVGFAAGWGLGVWRGTCKGHADSVFGLLDNKDALRNFLKGEVARKGGLDGIAKGIKRDMAFSTVIDEMFNRMEILRVTSMAAEYVFYAFLVAIAIGRHYPALLGIPVCLMTVKQAAKERGEPLGTQSAFQLFGMFHVWLRDNPVDVLNYVKLQKVPVRNITDLLRESGGYAI
jgi:hypothetical protein